MDNRRQPDIVHLEANPNPDGQDYIVADIHGNLACLQLALAKLTAKDRLIICGDVVDRGAHSIECIEHILDFQAKHPKQLYVLRGNHEIDCLDALLDLPLFAEDLLQINSPESLKTWLAELRSNPKYEACPTAVDNVSMLKDIGGEWLVQLFHQHLKDGSLTITPDHKISVKANSRLEKVAYFLTYLPYAYRVNDPRPYTCVHADMPETDATLSTTTQLSLEKKWYCVHAREKTCWRDSSTTTLIHEPHPRGATDPIVYCGHDVTLELKKSVVRFNTNHANLDAGAYRCHVLVMVNHTKATVELLSPTPLDQNRHSPSLLLLQQTLRDHLQREKLRYDTLTLPDNDEGQNPSIPRKRVTALMFTPENTALKSHKIAAVETSPSYFL